MNLPQNEYPISSLPAFNAEETLALRALAVRVCRRFYFESAHRLFDYVGKCSRLHGHNYELEVEVSGVRQPNGIVIDLADLKDVVNRHVVEVLDHRNLCDHFRVNTTAENLAVGIFRVLDALCDESRHPLTLERVRVQETAGCWAEVRREDFDKL